MRLRAIITALLFAVLVTGVSGSTASAETNTNGAAAQPLPATNVTVQAGDNLTKIGEANSTSYVRIYNANTNITDPDLILVGQQLRIPGSDEQLAERPLPAKVQAAIAAAPQPKATAPKPVAKRTSTASNIIASDGSVWDRIAQCESGGNWAINTGNGYYGGLQFSMSSWAAVGGSGNPANASRAEQIMRGQMLQSRQGWGAWPSCSAKLGLR